MSVLIIRFIILIAFTLSIKVVRKCKIASPGKVAGIIVLFPVAIFLVEFVATIALRGLASYAVLLSLIYAVGALVAEMLTVLVYGALCKYVAGENAGVGTILKRQPKWVLAVLGVLVFVSAALCYIQNVSLAGMAMNMSQIIENGAGNVSLLGVISDFESLKIFTYARNAIRIVVAALTAFGCRAGE